MAFEKTISITNEAISMGDIENLEEKIGKNFPQDYIEFLLKTNGGQFDLEDEHGIDVIGIDEEPIYIDVLFGIDENKCSDLFYWNNEYGDEIPEDAIIIGDALSHGFIIYNYSIEDKGIYYWDSTYAFESSDDDGNTYFVANDFNELMKKANLKID